MQVIRQIVERKSIKAVSVPEEFGEQVEIVVTPLDKSLHSLSEHSQLMKLQEQTGFARTVLADSSEDVWNEL